MCVAEDLATARAGRTAGAITAAAASKTAAAEEQAHWLADIMEAADTAMDAAPDP